MVFAPSKLLMCVALLAAASTHAADIESNPFSRVKLRAKLTHDNPASGLPVTAKMPKPMVVVEGEAITVAEYLVDPPMDPTAARRNLEYVLVNKTEDENNDVQKLQTWLKLTDETWATNYAELSTDLAVGHIAKVPWAGSYWPVMNDGINHRWQGDDVPSPAEKYAQAYGEELDGMTAEKFMNDISSTTGVDAFAADNKACTKQSQCDALGQVCAKRRGKKSGFCVDDWAGICHAWAPAAIFEQEPICPVEYNGVTFDPMDIKALMSQVYDGAGIPVVFTGTRFNASDPNPDDVDAYGRYVDPTRRDLGAGFFHLALANIMGKKGFSFVVDVDNKGAVWNQPIRSYKVLETKLYADPNEAAQKYFNTPTYPFNDDAKHIAYVKTMLNYIEESMDTKPGVITGIVDGYTVSKVYTYLLELDAAQNVIGGEWVGASQADHVDFLWAPMGRPDTEWLTDVGIDPVHINNLVDASVACVNGTMPATPAPTEFFAGPFGVTDGGESGKGSGKGDGKDAGAKGDVKGTKTDVVKGKATPVPSTKAPKTTKPAKTTKAPKTKAPKTKTPKTKAPKTKAPKATNASVKPSV